MSSLESDEETEHANLMDVEDNKIDDDYEELFSCYPQHFQVSQSAELSSKIIDTCSKKKKNAVIHCDLML